MERKPWASHGVQRKEKGKLTWLRQATYCTPPPAAPATVSRRARRGCGLLRKLKGYPSAVVLPSPTDDRPDIQLFPRACLVGGVCPCRVKEELVVNELWVHPGKISTASAMAPAISSLPMTPRMLSAVTGLPCVTTAISAWASRRWARMLKRGMLSLIVM